MLKTNFQFLIFNLFRYWRKKYHVSRYSQFRAGFTFIEVILYVAVLSLMLTALIPFIGNILVGGEQSRVQQEVSSNARNISEKIKYQIRSATVITSASGSTLNLNSSDVVITQSGSNITLNGVQLNSNDTTISNLTFTNLTTGVQFSFSISSNFTQTRKEYRSSLNVEGSAEKR